MIDTKVETFTAADAFYAGLDKAIERGETVITGSYRVDISNISGENFKQSNFTFKDTRGNLRVGKFADDNELIEFLALLKD